MTTQPGYGKLIVNKTIANGDVNEKKIFISFLEYVCLTHIL